MAEKTRASTTNERSSQRERPNPEEFRRESRTGANLFEQALGNYEQALKAGLRMQEESAKWWTTMFNETTSSHRWEKAASTFNTIPAAQRRWLEDTIRLLEQNSRRSLDLLKKASEAGTSLSPAEAQTRLQELWENSLLLLRSNVEAMTAANSRAVEVWLELVRQHAEMATNGAAK